MSICPYCKVEIGQMNGTPMSVEVGDKLVKGFAYSCPGCDKAISFQINPLILSDNIIDELKSEILMHLGEKD